MNSIAIPIAFIFLSLLFIWMLVEGRSHWITKFLVSIISVCLGVQMCFSLDSYRGYDKPVDQKAIAAKRAMVYWSYATEPDGTDPGKITLWMRMEDEISPTHWIFEKNKDGPQVYSFPYNRDMHKAIQTINKDITQNDNEPVEVVFSFQKQEQQLMRGGEGQREGGKIELYELPPPKLPPKVTQNH